MVFRTWQEAGGLVLACVMLGGCGDDGSSGETDTEGDTTGSPTSSPSTTLSTSSASTDPSTTSTGPDTTSDTTGETTATTGETTDATTSDGTTMMGTTEASTTGETDTTTAAECTEGDDDGDGICNDEDLCDDMLATHCLELGMNGSAVFEVYNPTTGVFDDLLDQDIVVGVSLDVASIAEPGACDSDDMLAKQYDATVVAIRMMSTDAMANAYLQDEVLAEFDLEGVGDTIRFVGQGGEMALFQAQFTAGMTPGHRFSLGDNASYMPDCDTVDLDSTITGTNALFQLDFVDMTGTMTDRVQGLGAEYTLYPVGG